MTPEEREAQQQRMADYDELCFGERVLSQEEADIIRKMLSEGTGRPTIRLLQLPMKVR